MTKDRTGEKSFVPVEGAKIPDDVREGEKIEMRVVFLKYGELLKKDQEREKSTVDYFFCFRKEDGKYLLVVSNLYEIDYRPAGAKRTIRGHSALYHATRDRNLIDIKDMPVAYGIIRFKKDYKDINKQPHYNFEVDMVHFNDDERKDFERRGIELPEHLEISKAVESSYLAVISS